MRIRLIGIFVLFICLPVWGQQTIVTVPEEPENLYWVKQRLIKYHECTQANCYGPQLQRQADVAIGFLKQSVADAKSGQKLAMVLDIDETSLSNWTVEKLDDFGYIPNDQNWCESLDCSRAIAATLRIFHEAEKDKVAVFFITGRPETEKANTESNLRLEGYDHWEGLYLRPANTAGLTVAQYKSGDRAAILSKGYRIVLSVGDQLSDLEGKPMADHSVKMPNPFYYIP